MTLGRRWYLVRTQPQREIAAELQLRNQGYETYLPKEAKTVRHARKIRTALGAYFPCYLFVALDLAQDRWRSINGTFGVSHLVMGRDRPMAAPEGVIEALIEASDTQGVLVSTRTFAVGERVRLRAGPFADQLAVIERMDGAGRVRLLLEIVGGQVPVQTSEALLAKAL